jgi:signal transduction histidine kinase
VFAIPERLLEGSESAVLEASGGSVLVAHEHAQRDLAAVVPLVRADTVMVLRARVAGAPSLVALAPVPTTDWVFAVALPLDVALAPLARLRNAALVSSLVFVVLVVLTATWAARSVTTPLAELAAQAGAFVRTGVHRPLPARGRDEVGALVETFNRMWGDLEASRHEIERLHAQILARAQQLATVGELASGVAHEIRNPLTSVLGALDLVLKRLPPADAARPLLEEAGRQLRRIETTTQQLLRYARPPELREVLVDANELIKRAAQLVAPQAAAAGVALRVEPSAAAVPVRVDPELMVQVLVNLLLNGIEAMSSGGDLLIWAARQAPEVRMGVRDTGPGVPADRRADIFRPFYTTKHTGTGLGLPISRQIVERHGGSLRLEDTPGGGATFVVALPLAEATGGLS